MGRKEGCGKEDGSVGRGVGRRVGCEEEGRGVRRREGVRGRVWRGSMGKGVEREYGERIWGGRNVGRREGCEEWVWGGGSGERGTLSHCW